MYYWIRHAGDAIAERRARVVDIAHRTLAAEMAPQIEQARPSTGEADMRATAAAARPRGSSKDGSKSIIPPAAAMETMDQSGARAQQPIASTQSAPRGRRPQGAKA
jgi:hypothetical protein